jgi:hypothetical protein
VTGISLAREPTPFFAEGIEIDEEKEKNAKHAELHANGAAGTEDIVFGRVRAIGGAESVIVETVTGNDEDDSECEKPGEENTETMALFRVFAGEDGTANACFGTHGLVSPI